MSKKSAAQPSIRRHILAGLVVIGVLVLGFGGWAGTTQLSGALIAPGQIVVDSNVKKVQHPTGGIVGEVRVLPEEIVQTAGRLRPVFARLFAAD